MNKPFSQACENNKQPILSVLQQAFAPVDYVLEVGSGTGQHAVYFAQHLSHLQWQPADQREYIPGVEAWRHDARLDNLLPALELEVCSPWPITRTPAVFSANTLHIMHWFQVEAFFAGLGDVLDKGGQCCIYGPFNYNGRHTSESNARFDQMLRQRDPGSGIRHFEDIAALAEEQGLTLQKDYAMPANNRLLHFTRAYQ